MRNSPREATNRVLELVEEGIIDKDYLISALLSYLSDDQVADMAWLNELFEETEEETV
jgi:ferritin